MPYGDSVECLHVLHLQKGLPSQQWRLTSPVALPALSGPLLKHFLHSYFPPSFAPLIFTAVSSFECYSINSPLHVFAANQGYYSCQVNLKNPSGLSENFFVPGPEVRQRRKKLEEWSRIAIRKLSSSGYRKCVCFPLQLLRTAAALIQYPDSTVSSNFKASIQTSSKYM